MSQTKAILLGLLAVNLPVFLLLVAPLFTLLAVNPEPELLGLLAFIPSFIFAWLWWSFFTPKWRLWAYARVKDVGALKEAAVRVGLTWPDGSIFTKTEIKSAEHAAKERLFEQDA